MTQPHPAAILGIVAPFVQRSLQHASIPDVLYDLSTTAVELLGGAGAGTSLAEQGGPLRFVSAKTELATRLEHVQEDTRQGPCQEAFDSGESFGIADLTHEQRWPAYVPKVLDAGVHAVLGVPMRIGDRSFGSLDVYDHGPRSWVDAEVEGARLLADIAVSHVMRTEELRQAHRLADQLRDALDGRVLIEQAKGVLAGERGVPVNEAFEMLRRHARRNRASLHSIARAVVKLGLRPEEPPR